MRSSPHPSGSALRVRGKSTGAAGGRPEINGLLGLACRRPSTLCTRTTTIFFLIITQSPSLDPSQFLAKRIRRQQRRPHPCTPGKEGEQHHTRWMVPADPVPSTYGLSTTSLYGLGVRTPSCRIIEHHDKQRYCNSQRASSPKVVGAWPPTQSKPVPMMGVLRGGPWWGVPVQEPATSPTKCERGNRDITWRHGRFPELWSRYRVHSPHESEISAALRPHQWRVVQ